MSHRIIRRTPEFDRQIFQLYGEVFGATGGERFEARWAWQYLENPNNDANDPIHWIAVEGDRLLGHLSTMPFQMWWGDREVRARSSLDQFVHPDARGRGIGIALVEAYMQDIELGLALGMTASSYPLFKKLFTDVGPVPAYLRVLDATAIVRRRWGALPAVLAGPVLNTGLALWTRRFASSKGIEVREVPSFGDEYTDLWMRVRGSFASVIRRDRAFLHWKYERCPYHAYRTIEARTRGALSGFAITRVAGEGPFRRGIIVDLFCETNDLGVQDALIEYAVSDFKAAGLARAETYCLHAGLGAAFRRHAFRAGQTSMNYCIAACRSSPVPLTRRTEHQLVLGDGDLDRG